MRDFVTASPDIARLVWWRLDEAYCAFCRGRLNNNEAANRQMRVEATSVSSCLCEARKLDDRESAEDGR